MISFTVITFDILLIFLQSLHITHEAEDSTKRVPLHKVQLIFKNQAPVLRVFDTCFGLPL
jgi:hypothetical protein